MIDRHHRLKDRLRLFDAVVTPTLLYGREVWILRADQGRRLKVAQRKMLRLVLNAKRRTLAPSSESDPGSGQKSDLSDELDVLEPWPEFLKRVSQWTDGLMDKGRLMEWTGFYRRGK